MLVVGERTVSIAFRPDTGSSSKAAEYNKNHQCKVSSTACLCGWSRNPHSLRDVLTKLESNYEPIIISLSTSRIPKDKHNID